MADRLEGDAPKAASDQRSAAAALVPTREDYQGSTFKQMVSSALSTAEATVQSVFGTPQIDDGCQHAQGVLGATAWPGQKLTPAQEAMNNGPDAMSMEQCHALASQPKDLSQLKADLLSHATPARNEHLKVHIPVSSTGVRG